MRYSLHIHTLMPTDLKQSPWRFSFTFTLLTLMLILYFGHFRCYLSPLIGGKLCGPASTQVALFWLAGCWWGIFSPPVYSDWFFFFWLIFYWLNVWWWSEFSGSRVYRGLFYTLEWLLVQKTYPCNLAHRE